MRDNAMSASGRKPTVSSGPIRLPRAFRPLAIAVHCANSAAKTRIQQGGIEAI
jgi:hypothetical protein